VRYFYKWVPVVIVAAIAILSLPWLGLIALLFALAAVAASAWAILLVPYRVGRTITRRWHGRSATSHRTATSAAS